MIPDGLEQKNKQLEPLHFLAYPFTSISHTPSSGDVMQLKPIRGGYIFEQPQFGSLRSVFAVFNIWEQFEVVVLEENHRQGKNKGYAELLGRLRFKEKNELMSEEDLSLLRSRILEPEDRDNLLQIRGKNATVNVINENRLDQLTSKLYVMEASHIPAKRNVYIKPAGTVEETAFLQTLRLKEGARIMLIHNINTLDGLTNGAQGTVVEILSTEDRVHYILIKFDNAEIGMEQRRKFRFLPSIAKQPHLTPIDRYSLSYTLGDVKKNHGASATLLQFPLKLAWASTSHKV